MSTFQFFQVLMGCNRAAHSTFSSFCDPIDNWNNSDEQKILQN
jgi:hypothetical protein